MWITQFPDKNFEVVGCDVELENVVHPFGKVRGGSLTVRGVLVHRTVDFATGKIGPGSADPDSPVQSVAETEDMEWCLKRSLRIFLDDQNGDTKASKPPATYPDSIVLLITEARRWRLSPVRGLMGLALLPKGENAFAHIGLFEVGDIWATKSEPHRRGGFCSAQDYADHLHWLCGGQERTKEIVLI
ncbi:hypothetical protein GQ53DRAFT_821743 [Thozetella sp. PMI_491]|nr:hypothetical protein GQ53DRAFT_821743 [Thozetella sp. PMI_491]